jgi:integrase
MHAPSKLTQRFVDSLKFAGKEFAVRDTQIPGFLVGVNRRSKSFKVQADLWEGHRGSRRLVKTCRVTIGRVGELSVEEARAKALGVLAQIKAGIDPNAPPAPAPAPAWTVGEAFARYAEDLGIRQKADRTIADLQRLLGSYLSDWTSLPLTSISREMCRERHARVSRDNGKVAANQALRALRTVHNFARRAQDVPLGENPVVAVTFHPERSANRSIALPDLGSWHGKVQALPNPLRRLMHEIGLFSGLRPGNLVALERGWVNLERRAIVIPAASMKARREFALPLSAHLLGLVKRALELSEMLHPGHRWLFPTRARDGSVIATQVWKEDTLPSETGHMLRHTYSNVARHAGVDDVDRELLLAHKIPGVQGVYLDAPTLFSRLLEQQERISKHLLGLIAQ